jgi:chromosome segregation ATPase
MRRVSTTEEKSDDFVAQPAVVAARSGSDSGAAIVARWRRPGLSLALILALGMLVGGALWGRDQLATRDAVLASQQATLAAQLQEISRRETGAAAAQEKISALTEALDRVQATADGQAQQLQAATQQAQAADDRAKAADARAAGAETRARDAEARAMRAQQDAGTAQQSSQQADARGAALTRVIDIDNQIVSEVRSLMNQWLGMLKAGSTYAMQQALINQAATLDRIDTLLRQREAALNRVPTIANASV